MIDTNRQIAIIWSVEDVQEVRPDLNDEQAMKVLLTVKKCHDAAIGVTFETLEIAADNIYPREENEDKKAYNIVNSIL